MFSQENILEKYGVYNLICSLVYYIRSAFIENYIQVSGMCNNSKITFFMKNLEIIIVRSSNSGYILIKKENNYIYLQKE